MKRFIPACAGNTCGWRVQDAAGFGSSPRARGTRSHSSMKHCVARFIPACAGNTTTWGAAAIARSGSSPRARGTRCRCASTTVNPIGSSPRARGTHLRRGDLGSRHRFIPACAGNTTALSYAPSIAPVHPRVRGEHLHRPRIHRRSCPVHPRVRGEHTGTHGAWRHRHRFIPACAGNTLPASLSSATIIRLSKNLPIGTFVPGRPIDHVDASVRVASTDLEGQPQDRTIPTAGHPHLPALAGSSHRSRIGSPSHSARTRRSPRCHLR